MECRSFISVSGSEYLELWLFVWLWALSLSLWTVRKSCLPLEAANVYPCFPLDGSKRSDSHRSLQHTLTVHFLLCHHIIIPHPPAQGGALICIFSAGPAVFKSFTNRDNYLRMVDCERSLLTPQPSAAVSLSPSRSRLSQPPPAVPQTLLSVFNWHHLQQDGGGRRTSSACDSCCWEREHTHHHTWTSLYNIHTNMETVTEEKTLHWHHSWCSGCHYGSQFR